MTIDLSTLKIGDKVEYRNGEEFTIISVRITKDNNLHYPVSIILLGSNGKETSTFYRLNGLWHHDTETGYDIVKIIPKEEPIKNSNISTIPGITGKGDLSKKPHPRALNPDLLNETAKCFRFGQMKHGVDNFRKMDAEAAGELIDALMRHVNDYLRGETHASDSGLHHLAHADANLHMLYRIIMRHGDKEVLKVISGGDIK